MNRLSVSFKKMLVVSLAHRKARCRGQVALWVRLDVPSESSSQTFYYVTEHTDPANNIYTSSFSHLTDTRRKLDFENILGPSYKYGGVGDAFGGGSQ